MTASAPCWTASFSICCLLLITIWVTPGNRFAKAPTSQPSCLHQDFQGPQMGSSFSRVESVQIACIGPLSTTQHFGADTSRSAAGVVDRKPQASSQSASPTDSPVGPDPGCPSDRSAPDTASFPYEAATMGLLWAGLADAEQRRIPVHRRTTAAFQEATGAARSQCQP